MTEPTDQEKFLSAWVEAGKGGYTTEQLSEAFKLVCAKIAGGHWKGPIDVLIEGDDALARILLKSIPFHCGGPAPIIQKVAGGRLYIRHRGYWHYIGS